MRPPITGGAVAAETGIMARLPPAVGSDKVTGSPPPAIAANEALLELLKVLRDKGTLSPQEYELLVEASKEDNEKIKESIKIITKFKRKN